MGLGWVYRYRAHTCTWLDVTAVRADYVRVGSADADNGSERAAGVVSETNKL